MVDWGPRDYQSDRGDEAEDVTDEVEEDDINLELIINVYIDQYRPQEQFILDDFSLDDMIPPMDKSYMDQLEQAEREALGKMVQERRP